MITIILMDSSEKRLATVGVQGNEQWLCGHRSLTFFGGVDEYSYSVFGPEDVPVLLHELNEIKKRLTTPDAVAHIDDIVELVRLLEVNHDGYLMLTPFEK